MDLNSLSQNPEQIKQLIGLLQALLPTEDNIDKPKPKKARTKRTSKATSTSNNKFLQMPESNMHKEDLAVDKKLAKFPPTPRSRKFDTIEVSCRSCGRTEIVNPVLVHDRERYKCNRCAASK